MGTNGKITDVNGKTINLTDIKEGDVVRITHEGVVSQVQSYEGYITFKANGGGYGGGRKVRVSGGQYGYYTAYPMYDVQLVKSRDPEPSGGPARAGDVWTVNGIDYFAVKVNYSGDLRFYPSDNYNFTYVSGWNDFKKMKPTLKTRDGAAVKK